METVLKISEAWRDYVSAQNVARGCTLLVGELQKFGVLMHPHDGADVAPVRKHTLDKAH